MSLATVGVTELNLPGPCEGPYGARRKFYVGAPDFVKLDVPNAVEDKILRWEVRGDPGVNHLYRAYQSAGIVGLFPEEGMVPCCYDVLRTKWYDPVAGVWKVSGWGNTCAGYWACFTKYVEALRRDRKRGRIDLGAGITVPSPEEQACMRRHLVQIPDVRAAYTDCDAADILPPPGVLIRLSDIITRNPGASFYEALKVAAAIAPTPTGDGPVTPIIHHGADQERGKYTTYLIYGGVAVVALLALRD